MKTITEEKERFLIENGYVDNHKAIKSYEYEDLSEDEKKEYTLIENSGEGYYETKLYIKKSNFPDLTDADFQQIIVLEKDRKLRRMEEHFNTIKYCALVLAGATILSVIASIISIINLMNL